MTADLPQLAFTVEEWRQRLFNEAAAIARASIEMNAARKAGDIELERKLEKHLMMAKRAASRHQDDYALALLVDQMPGSAGS